MDNAQFDLFLKDLSLVTTGSDAARRYGMSLPALTERFEDGRIAAIKVGGIWLVSQRSLNAYFTVYSFKRPSKR